MIAAIPALDDPPPPSPPLPQMLHEATYILAALAILTTATLLFYLVRRACSRAESDSPDTDPTQDARS